MIRLIHDGPAQGAWNMAVDEAIMASGRDGLVSVRFYEWDPGCLSFGRNQTASGQYDAAAAEELGIDVVRRPTGGRAVYHHRELTYSVSAPVEAWGSLRDAYCRINSALAAGLQALGAPVVCAGSGPAITPRPTARACFRDPLPGEVTAEGRKLVGSAQWRDGAALLQHGSLLLVNEQHVTEDLRLRDAAAVAGPSADHTGAIALDDLLEETPPVNDIVASLVCGFESEFDSPVELGALDSPEMQLAHERRGHYLDPAWTWRR